MQKYAFNNRFEEFPLKTDELLHFRFAHHLKSHTKKKEI